MLEIRLDSGVNSNDTIVIEKNYQMHMSDALLSPIVSGVMTGISRHIGGGIPLAGLLSGVPAFVTIAAVLIIQCLFFTDESWKDLLYDEEKMERADVGAINAYLGGKKS